MTFTTDVQYLKEVVAKNDPGHRAYEIAQRLEELAEAMMAIAREALYIKRAS